MCQKMIFKMGKKEVDAGVAMLNDTDFFWSLLLFSDNVFQYSGAEFEAGKLQSFIPKNIQRD